MRFVWGLSMRVGGKILAMMAGFIACASVAQAGSADFAGEFGTTKPPIGFIKFCAAAPSDCEKSGRSTLFTQRLDMTPEMWNAAFKINAYVNNSIKPVSDIDLYGVVEKWTIPVDAGDCEDYVLLKKRDLESLGFPSSSLLITVVLDEKQEGHAVLTLSTKQGDYILDNRRDQILRWNDVNYTFLKRQSASDPLQWTALNKRQEKTVPVVSTRSDGASQ